MRRPIRMLVLVLAMAALQWGASAQTDPRTLPLDAAANWSYEGYFTLPSGWQWGAHAMEVTGDQMTIGCGVTAAGVLRIPALGATAQIVEACRETPAPQVLPGTPNGWNIGGFARLNGQLWMSAYATYTNTDEIGSHFRGVSLASLGSMTRIGQTEGIKVGMLHGPMAVVPQEWRALLGGSLLASQCCLSIIGRTSLGPSVVVFDPATLAATHLVGYPIDRPTLGVWEQANTYYGMASMHGGLAIIPGTRTLLTVGRLGDTACYGGVPPCVDPVWNGTGNHGYKYRPTMLAYDVNDLLAVKAGTKRYWEPVPYAKWAIPGLTADEQWRIRGATFDAASMRLFLAVVDSDRVYVLRHKGAAPPPPPPPVDCAGTWSAWARVTGSETACVAGARNFTETRDFTVTTPASHGGKACPVSPETRVLAENCTVDPPPPGPAIRLECDRITTITRGADYVGGDQRWTVRGICREINAAGVVVGPPKD